jgi:hypothetical protein
VAQGVQVRVDAEAIGEPLEPLAHRAGVARPGSVGSIREHKARQVKPLAN